MNPNYKPGFIDGMLDYYIGPVTYETLADNNRLYGFRYADMINGETWSEYSDED